LPTSSSAASVPNPWKALDRLGLVLERAAIPERAILWHEIAHAVRGDVQCLQGPLDRRQEVACWRYAARRAIPLRALLEALRWSDQTHEVADQLKTTEEMLEVRLVALHPAERGACRRVVQGRS
jgi:hypothetical protein